MLPAAGPGVADRAHAVYVGKGVVCGEGVALQGLRLLMVTLPVGTSLTLSTALVAALVTLSGVLPPSV